MYTFSRICHLNASFLHCRISLIYSWNLIGLLCIHLRLIIIKVATRTCILGGETSLKILVWSPQKRHNSLPCCSCCFSNTCTSHISGICLPPCYTFPWATCSFSFSVTLTWFIRHNDSYSPLTPLPFPSPAPPIVAPFFLTISFCIPHFSFFSPSPSILLLSCSPFGSLFSLTISFCLPRLSFFLFFVILPT